MDDQGLGETSMSPEVVGKGLCIQSNNMPINLVHASGYTPHQSACSFMGLPIEVREMIYDYVFEPPSSSTSRPYPTSFGPNYRALIRTSKQIYLDTTQRLYASRRFHLVDEYAKRPSENDAARFLFKIGPQNRALIRRLSLDFSLGMDWAQAKLRGMVDTNQPANPVERHIMHYDNMAMGKAMFALAVLTHSITTQPLWLRELEVVLPAWSFENSPMPENPDVEVEVRGRAKYFDVLKRIRGLELLTLGFTVEFDMALDLAREMKTKKMRVRWRRGYMVTVQKILELIERGWVMETDREGSIIAVNPLVSKDSVN